MKTVFGLFLFCIGLYARSVQSCGSQNSTRIAGGQHAYHMKWPFMARLKIHKWFQNGEFRCGGSLISDDWVLTAAHCVINAYDVQVVLAEHNETDQSGNDKRLVIKGTPVIYPYYDKERKKNDIALIKLNQSVASVNYLDTVCLPFQDYYGQNCHVMGWGETSFLYGGESPVLKDVSVDILTHEDCKKNWDLWISNKLFQFPYAKEIIEPFAIHPNSQICAGNLVQGSLKGDSGGPLVCQLPNGAWVQKGVTSYGEGGNDWMSASVYTRVAAFMPWIMDMTGITANKFSANYTIQ